MKIRFINLDRSTDRLATFRRANQHLASAERFAAIDGKLLSRDELVSNGTIAPDLQDYSPGALGAALSHMTLWQEAPVTIAEDDALFHRDFERLSRDLLASVSGWDIILWGWSFNAVCCFDLVENTPCALVGDEAAMHANAASFQTQDRRYSLFRLRQAFGLGCYSLSEAGAQRLTKASRPIRPFALWSPLKSEPIRNYGIDIVMAAQYEKMNALVCVPPLVLLMNAGESTIQQSKPPAA